MGLFEVCKHADHDARMLLNTSWRDQDGEITQIWQCEECKATKITTTFGLIEDVTKMRPDQLPRTPFG